MSLRLAVLVPFVVSLLRGCAAPAPVATTTASALRESVGVNLHLEYDDTPYADPRRTERALRLLGLAHVRDSAMRSGPAKAWRFSELAQAGMRFDLFVNANQASQIASVAHLAKDALGAVDLIEGPNEANHEAFDHHAAGDAVAVREYQKALFAGVRENPVLAGVPVANFTYWPPLVGRADWSNFHAYPGPSEPPARRLNWMRGMASAVQPPRSPDVCTESGYTTAGADSVSEETQAALTPVLILENFRTHVVRTYLYELFDEHPDPDTRRPDRENHFGLFRFDGRPKPAALSVARLMGILAENAEPVRGDLSRLGLSGRSLRSLEVARSDGARLTFAWWSDAQSVHGRPLTIHVPSGADIRMLDLVSGGGVMLKPGRRTILTGASPLVFVQTTPSA